MQISKSVDNPSPKKGQAVQGVLRTGTRTLQLRYSRNTWLLVVKAGRDNLRGMRGIVNETVSQPRLTPVSVVTNLAGKLYVARVQAQYLSTQNKSGVLNELHWQGQLESRECGFKRV